VRIALLGGRGQLGTDLYPALAGHEVVAFGHDDFDIRDTARARERLTACHPDVILNTTAFHKVEQCEEDPDTSFAVNATAPQRLAKLAQELGAQFVHLSTDYVYGGNGVRRLTETVPPAPVQVYGATKAAGEWLIQLAHPSGLIVRSSGLFGIAGASGKGGNFIQTVIRLAREKGQMRIVNDQYLSPTYTADLAIAIVQLIEHRVTGIVHVTNSESCSWYEFARQVVATAGLNATVSPISTVEFGAQVRRPAYSVLDNERWRTLGLEPLRSWQEALRAYLEAESLGPAAGVRS
jgi:dTDP-4-dehydrorhamnose reductase